MNLNKVDWSKVTVKGWQIIGKKLFMCVPGGCKVYTFKDEPEHKYGMVIGHLDSVQFISNNFYE